MALNQSMNETIEKLQKLGELFEAGVLSKEELEIEKQRVFAASSQQSSSKPSLANLPRKWTNIGIASIVGIGVIIGVVLATRKSPEVLCQQGIAYVQGKGVQKDVDKGLSLLRKSAKRGNVVAMREIANTFVVQGKTKEYIEWYNKAINAGDIISANQLATIFMNGNESVKKDYSQAIRYLKKVLELDNNNAEACVNLGKCYEGKDASRAVKYYQQASNLNSPEGLYRLASCYDKGIGVSPDHNKAMEYMKKAAALGDADATNYINELQRQEMERERARERERYKNEIVPCPSCGGRGRKAGMGFDSGTIVTCGTCGGSGYVTRDVWDFVKSFSIW